MVKRQHKIMCLVLCLMLAVSTVFVGVVSASAATGDTVYVRVNNGWSKVNRSEKLTAICGLTVSAATHLGRVKQ